MNEKLKFPLKLNDGTIINSMEEVEVLFKQREQEIRESLCNKESRGKEKLSSNYYGSGLRGYGLNLILGKE